MIFFLLAALSVILAVIRVQLMRVGDPSFVRGALARGGLAYLAYWIVGTGIFGPAGLLRIPGLSSPVVMDIVAIVSGLLALAVWTSVVDLAFYRFRSRDLVWILLFCPFAIVLGGHPKVSPMVAAVVAAPALLRTRWRRDIGSGQLSAATLIGFLFVLLYFVSIQIPGNVVSSRPILVEIAQFSNWILSITTVYLLLSLPRMAWGTNVHIPNVRIRLLVSHLLTGLVPVILVGVFWGLSTHLSVLSDRAQVSVRHLEEEASRIGVELEAGLSEPEKAEGRLTGWSRLEAKARPGFRLYLELPGSGPTGQQGWVRVQGRAIEGEEALVFWPDTTSAQGIVLVEGEAYLGAIRRRGISVGRDGRATPPDLVLGGRGGPDSDSQPAGPIQGPHTAVVLIPVESVLSGATSELIDAAVSLDSRLDVVGSGGLVTISPDSLGQGTASPNRAMGGAIIDALELENGIWSEEPRQPLIRADVGFVDTIRGLTRNLQENPLNLIPLFFLGGVAFLFVLVEVLTLGMVISMGGSITRALGAIHKGTTRLREGNLRYRIPIEGRDDLWEVAESFNRMADTLEQARDLEIEKERIEGELELAHKIQSRLLPSEAPLVYQTELAGLSLPAREVGGDYYDFLELPGGRIGLIVADVSGKGVPAALLMSSFRAALLSQELDVGPAELMARLNTFLHRSVEPGRFVTAFLGVFEPRTGALLYCNAGHNPPYLLGLDGRPRTMKEGGLVLGLFAEGDYEEAEVQVHPGDMMVLFTDGVTEAQNAEEDLWGEDRLIQTLLRNLRSPCRKIVAEILEELRRFSGNEPQSDDITLLLARWRGPVAPAETREDATAVEKPLPVETP